MSRVPVRRGYAEALLGYDGTQGLWGRAEAGLHPVQGLALFGFGEVSQAHGAMAGAGARLTFDL